MNRGEKDSEVTPICDANAGRKLTSCDAMAKRAAVILGTQKGMCQEGGQRLNDLCLALVV